MRYIITASILVAALASVTSADFYIGQPSFYLFVSHDETSKPGYVINRLTIHSDTDWFWAEMVVNPTGVTSPIYNRKPGAAAPYWSEVYSPDLGDPMNEYDSFVTAGMRLGTDPDYPDEVYWAQAASSLGALDLDGSLTAAWTSTAISQSWLTMTHDDIGTFMIAQVTIKTGAMGTWGLLTKAEPDGGPFILCGWVIEGGRMIPEPATMALLVLGGLAALRRRK